MRKCPFCAETIQDEARKCRFCGEWLVESEPQPADISSGAQNKEATKRIEDRKAGMAAKECPVCKLLNPGIALRCDCGYAFDKGLTQPAITTIERRHKPEKGEEDFDANEIDDKKYRTLKAKYESMGIDELLGIRESYVAHDYQPEARKALKEVFAEKKEELDCEDKSISEEEEVVEEIPKFKLGRIYINISLIASGSSGLLLIALIIMGIFRTLGSIGPAEIVLMLIMLVPVSLTFLTAIGLQKRKKYAITLTYVSLALNSILGFFLLFVGLSRPVEGFLIAVISGCWAVYFYRRRQYFR